MSVFLLTGKLGSGKSLASVDRAIEYANKGRRIVANFPLDLSPVAKRGGTPLAKSYVEVIPARPTHHDLTSLGRGGLREEIAGLLILDECAVWLNARGWADKERDKVIDWFLHSRKLGWDIILIVQHPSAMDKQVREMICEYLVTCRRLDRMKIPLIGLILPGEWYFPRIHLATVRYGLDPNAPKVETWVYRGNGFFACYNTEWQSTFEQNHYCTLPAQLTKFKNQKPFKMPKYANQLIACLVLACIGYISSLSSDRISVAKSNEPKKITAGAAVTEKPKLKSIKYFNDPHPTAVAVGTLKTGNTVRWLLEVDGVAISENVYTQFGFHFVGHQCPIQLVKGSTLLKIIPCSVEESHDDANTVPVLPQSGGADRYSDGRPIPATSVDRLPPLSFMPRAAQRPNVDSEPE